VSTTQTNETPQYFVGFDIASESFTLAVGTMPWQLLHQPVTFPNTQEGFRQCLDWLTQRQCTPDTSLLCLEATGVYGEAMTYFFTSKGYPLVLEHPLKVKRAFDPSGRKTDAVDSKQIAEYAVRFLDELHFWKPPVECLEQMDTLLATRERYVTQRTATQNALTALLRKHVRTPLAEQLHQQTLEHLKDSIQAIDAEMAQLIDQDQGFREKVALLRSIPGVGLLLAAHLCVHTEGFTQALQPKPMAAYLGICPLEHTSGTSVYRPAQSRHFGPSRMRKLLYLASLSLRTHQATFKHYFLRKVAEGKSKRLVLNNIANKLVRLICAVLRDGKPFVPNYVSVNPNLLTNA